MTRHLHYPACAIAILFAVGGCDRRAAEPVEASQADNATYMATDAASPNASPSTADGVATSASPPISASPGTAAPADNCAGLTGQAALDCAANAATPSGVEVPDPPEQPASTPDPR